jgi:flagellar motor switch/type III secretory pathway protein FliN
MTSDLVVPLEVRIGAREMTLEAIQALDVGSIIAFERLADEALDLFVGNVRLGSVEVVVTGAGLAARIAAFDERIEMAPL